MSDLRKPGAAAGSGDCEEERRGAPRVPLLALSSSTPYLRFPERLAQISYGGIAMRDAIETEN
jgi:hypothetical protein